MTPRLQKFPIGWVAALILALCVMIAGAAQAQNYDSLNTLNFGGNQEEAPAPAAEGADDGSPDLQAYGQVAEVYKEQSTIQMTQERVGVFQQKLRRFINSIPRYGEEFDRALSERSPTGDASYFLGVALFTGLLLAIGRAGTILWGVFLGLRIMRRIQKPNPVGVVDKLPVLAARVGISIVGTLIAVAIALTIGSGFYVDDEVTIQTAFTIIAAYVTIQMIDVCWRMTLSPFLPAYRIPELSDSEARRLYRWLAFGALFGVSSSIFYNWLSDMGASEEVVGVTIIGTTFTSVLIILGLIYRCGSAISHAMLGGLPRAEAPWPAALATYLWRPVVVAYLVFAFLEMSFRVISGLELGIPLLGGALAVLLSVLVVYAVTVYVVERIFQRFRRMRELNETAEANDREEELDAQKAAIRDALEDVGDEEGGAGPVAIAETPSLNRKGMRTFEDLARRVASLFALGAGVYLMIRIWVGEGAFADGSIADIVQDLIDVAFVGYIVFHAVRIWIDQKIEEETGPEIELEPGDEGGAAAAASRLGTLLPLFRSFILIVIATSAILLIAMEMGVNVAPLFAGAGVVGLAIGFGAQSLVRDILSGVFFLTDDAFRKGEYIDVGDVKGTVEKISLRSFQLRHHLGALNTIPFGEIKHLTNYSRDWVMMKLPLRLTYDTDVDKVRKLVKKLGVKLLDHPTEGHKFVQPLKSQGVYMMEDSAMIIRIKFMTRPGDQWTTRKLVYQEIRNLFEKEGIKFAHKEVTVRIPEIESRNPEDLTDQDRKAIGAAARRVVEEEMPQPAMADDR
ncbi:MAG: mechanosensitive ion channel family protein [Pseudomonadota bacterium]